MKTGRFEIGGSWKKITALCVFQKGILPAWEHEKNKMGGDFSTVIKKCSKEEVKTHWDQLTMLVISGSFKYADNVRT